MTRATKKQSEGARLASVIDDALKLFQEKFPEDWAECATYPVGYALPHIAAKLRSLD